MKLELTNRTEFTFDPATLRQLLDELEEQISGLPETISLVFVDDGEISDLNERYYNREGVTDVLSFNYGEDLAEIILNPYQHRRQADDYENTFEIEVVENLIHGLLHVAGYDHTSPEDDGRHLARQRELTEAVEEMDLSLFVREVEKS